MPIYDYICPHCGKHFEMMRHVAEATQPARCSCGHDARRLIAAPSLHGLDTGPGNRFSEQTFMRFHIPTEVRNTMRKMELDGVPHRNPRLWQAAMRKYKAIKQKEHTYPVVDYEKIGHPALEGSK